MFTGIIHHCGTILSINNHDGGRTLAIATQFEHLVLGESIAVDGICLTVTAIATACFYCDISPETLTMTTAQYLQPGQKVNLERALKVGDSLGGHWVSGHIDHTATIKSILKHGAFCEVQVDLSAHSDSLIYLIPKGSITVNGVSLTINQLTQDGFTVMLIPETLTITNLSQLTIDTQVNIEIDMMSKIITRQCQAWLQQYR